jgi:hypothetical protein
MDKTEKENPVNLSIRPKIMFVTDEETGERMCIPGLEANRAIYSMMGDWEGDGDKQTRLEKTREEKLDSPPKKDCG